MTERKNEVATMLSGRVSWRRLWWVGLLAIGLSLISNLVIRAVGITVFNISSAFLPLGIGPVVFWSVVMGIGATIVFWLVGSFSRNPVPVFLLIALLVYLSTFYPDYLVLFAGSKGIAGTTFYAVITLLSMHFIEACIITCVFILLGFERTDRTGGEKKEVNSTLPEA